MDAMSIIGFTFGTTAFTFAIIGWGQIAKLQKEVTDLKQDLVRAGVPIDKQD